MITSSDIGPWPCEDCGRETRQTVGSGPYSRTPLCQRCSVTRRAFLAEIPSVGHPNPHMDPDYLAASAYDAGVL